MKSLNVILIMMLFLLSYNAPSKIHSLNFKFASFEDAEKNVQNYLKFIGTSTKFKIFTTSFTGHAKEFNISYQKSMNSISNIKIQITTNQLDTDNNSRNAKMHEKCLEVTTYPTISAEATDVVKLENDKNGEIAIQLKIRDKLLSRKLKYIVKKVDNSFEISFSTDFSLVEAAIPDPSIAIAKVGEIFIIEGKILIK